MQSLSLHTHNYLLLSFFFLSVRFFFRRKIRFQCVLSAVFLYAFSSLLVLLLYALHIHTCTHIYRVVFLFMFSPEFKIILYFFYDYSIDCRYIWLDAALLISNQVVKSSGCIESSKHRPTTTASRKYIREKNLIF